MHSCISAIPSINAMTKASRARSFLSRLSCRGPINEEPAFTSTPIARPRSADAPRKATSSLKSSRSSTRSMRKLDSSRSTVYSVPDPNSTAPVPAAVDVPETEFGPFVTPGESVRVSAEGEYFQQEKEPSPDLPDPANGHGLGDELLVLATNRVSVRQTPQESVDDPHAPRAPPAERAGEVVSPTVSGDGSADLERGVVIHTEVAPSEKDVRSVSPGTTSRGKSDSPSTGASTTFKVEESENIYSQATAEPDNLEAIVVCPTYERQSISTPQEAHTTFQVVEEFENSPMEAVPETSNAWIRPVTASSCTTSEATEFEDSDSEDGEISFEKRVASLISPNIVVMIPEDPEVSRDRATDATEAVPEKRDVFLSMAFEVAKETESDTASLTSIETDDMEDITPTAISPRHLPCSLQEGHKTANDTENSRQCAVAVAEMSAETRHTRSFQSNTTIDCSASPRSSVTEFEDNVLEAAREESDLWMIPPRIAISLSESTNRNHSESVVSDGADETPTTAILLRNPPPWMQEPHTAVKGVEEPGHDNASLTSIETDDMEDDVTPTANSSRAIPPWLLQEHQKTAKEKTDTSSFTTIETDDSGSIYTPETSEHHPPQEIHIPTAHETGTATPIEPTTTDRLIAAILSHDLPLVTSLLQASHINLNTPDSQGRYPILLSLQTYLSSAGGDDGILETLLTRPAINLNTLPLLHTAVSANNPRAVELLLARNDLDVNLSSSDITSLELAISQGREGQKVVGLLLKRKDLDVNKNAVIHAAIKGGCEETVRLLVGREDLDVNRAHEGWVPAELAVELAAKGEGKMKGEGGDARGILGILRERGDLHHHGT